MIGVKRLEVLVGHWVTLVAKHAAGDVIATVRIDRIEDSHVVTKGGHRYAFGEIVSVARLEIPT